MAASYKDEGIWICQPVLIVHCIHLSKGKELEVLTVKGEKFCIAPKILFTVVGSLFLGSAQAHMYMHTCEGENQSLGPDLSRIISM